MSTATWVKNTLEHEGLRYDELHHPEAFTAQEVAQREHISGHRVAKVVVAMADGHPVELILPATRRVRLEAVRRLLLADEIRLANEEEIAKHFDGCDRGAIPALRHWPRIALLMDGWMHVDGDIIFPAGTHNDAVRMRFADWFRMVDPRVEDFSEPADYHGEMEEDAWEEDEW